MAIGLSPVFCCWQNAFAACVYGFSIHLQSCLRFQFIESIYYQLIINTIRSKR